METSSHHMHSAMDEGHKRIDKILLIKPDQVQGIGKRLNEIVNTCLEIDIRTGDASQLKRQKLDDDVATQQ
jgi:hypothetical protein